MIFRFGWSFQGKCTLPLQWRHNERDGVCQITGASIVEAPIKETSKLSVDGLCEGNPPVIPLTKGQ